MTPAQPQPARVTWTYADYRLMPDDGKRYEIIEGDLLVTPAPTTTHQTVSKRIQLALMLQIEEKGLGAVFDAPIDLIASETTTVQPDLVVVRQQRRNIITERGIEGPPDLVVEILSPTTERVDRSRKRKLYAAIGVAEYWIADPTSHTVEVLALHAEGYRTVGVFGPGQALRSTLFELDLTVDRVFAP